MDKNKLAYFSLASLVSYLKGAPPWQIVALLANIRLGMKDLPETLAYFAKALDYRSFFL
jgi:hypothetical protein